MNLGRIVLAWFLVALWFGIATVATADFVARIAMPGAGFVVQLRILRWRLVEAALLTLLASLWFDALGSGGWWLLFALIGSLVTLQLWFLDPPAQLPRRAIVAGALVDMARYIVAGALLAWRLT